MEQQSRCPRLPHGCPQVWTRVPAWQASQHTTFPDSVETAQTMGFAKSPPATRHAWSAWPRSESRRTGWGSGGVSASTSGVVVDTSIPIRHRHSSLPDARRWPRVGSTRPDAMSWLVGSGRRAPVALSGRKGAPSCGPISASQRVGRPLLPHGRPGDDHEAYVSTQCPASCEEARLSCSHEHSRRTEHPQESPRQGPRPTLGLIQRIHGRHAFSTLSRDGRRIRRSSLWCSWCPQPSSNATRVAYSIGRACGPAVTRNRLRRRLRAIIRSLDQHEPLPPGLLLIGAKPGAVELTFDQLRTETEQLLRSAISPATPVATR